MWHPIVGGTQKKKLLSYRNLEEMMLEQDHHFFKRLVKLGMGFFSFLSVFCNTTTWSLGNPD
jgi:hypothetical protein